VFFHYGGNSHIWFSLLPTELDIFVSVLVFVNENITVHRPTQPGLWRSSSSPQETGPLIIISRKFRAPITAAVRLSYFSPEDGAVVAAASATFNPVIVNSLLRSFNIFTRY